jgi:hypothetical protein
MTLPQGEDRMKVRELIDRLDRLDPDAEVKVPFWESLTEGTVETIEELDDGSVFLSPTEEKPRPA